MKKLLGILGSIGIIASSSSLAVSCVHRAPESDADDFIFDDYNIGKYGEVTNESLCLFFTDETGSNISSDSTNEDQDYTLLSFKILGSKILFDVQKNKNGQRLTSGYYETKINFSLTKDEISDIDEALLDFAKNPIDEFNKEDLKSSITKSVNDKLTDILSQKQGISDLDLTPKLNFKKVMVSIDGAKPEDWNNISDVTKGSCTISEIILTMTLLGKDYQLQASYNPDPGPGPDPTPGEKLDISAIDKDKFYQDELKLVIKKGNLITGVSGQENTTGTLNDSLSEVLLMFNNQNDDNVLRDDFDTFIQYSNASDKTDFINVFGEHEATKQALSTYGTSQSPDGNNDVGMYILNDDTRVTVLVKAKDNSESLKGELTFTFNRDDYESAMFILGPKGE
jgi:hypothetical protein